MDLSITDMEIYCRVPPPRGFKLRWREDMGGGLPTVCGNRALAEASNLLGYKEYKL